MRAKGRNKVGVVRTNQNKSFVLWFVNLLLWPSDTFWSHWSLNMVLAVSLNQKVSDLSVEREIPTTF